MRTKWFLVPAVAAALCGCVERKMFIHSDPPGADVYMEDERLDAVTPAEVDFDWGGRRRVTLALPGYRVLDGVAEVEDPWYTYFPLELVTEFLWPFTIEDHQTFTFELEPYHPLDERLTDEQRAEIARRMEELKLRAEEYRAGGSEGPGGIAAPAPAPAKPAIPEPTEEPSGKPDGGATGDEGKSGN